MSSFGTEAATAASPYNFPSSVPGPASPPPLIPPEISVEAHEIHKILPHIPLYAIQNIVTKFAYDNDWRGKSVNYLLNEDLASIPQWTREIDEAYCKCNTSTQTFPSSSRAVRNQGRNVDKHHHIPEKRKNEIESDDMEEEENASRVKRALNEEEQKKHEKLNILFSLFPDCDENYLLMKIDEFQGNDDALQVEVQRMLEHRAYPHGANEAFKSEDLKQKYTDISLKEFMSLVEDPLEYFYNLERRVSGQYKELALEYLKSIFPFETVKTIRKVLSKSNGLLAPSVRAIQEECNVQRQTLRSNSEIKQLNYTDEEFLKELAFLRFESAIIEYEKQVRHEDENELEEAQRTGTTLECPVCCEDSFLFKNMKPCIDGHLFCESCVRKHAEELIGQGRVDFPCLDPSCNLTFSYGILQQVLRPSVLSRVLRRKQTEEIQAANIPHLVCCPFCDFATIMENPNDKIFKCLDPECMKESCRICKRPSHIPRRCEEIHLEEQTEQAHKYLENVLSEAMIRTCWKCEKRFMKEEGCNKMTCSCGAKMCYLCRKPVEDYAHFAYNDPKKCPLWTDSLVLHAKEVQAKAVEATKQLQEENPQLELKNDLTKYMPEIPADRAQEEEERLLALRNWELQFHQMQQAFMGQLPRLMDRGHQAQRARYQQNQLPGRP